MIRAGPQWRFITKARDEKTMKAITLWQPWATFIALKWKTIETRTHSRFKSLVGQRIAIHAGRTVDRWGIWFDFLPPDLDILKANNIETLITISRGTIVCTATITAARWAPNVDFMEREEWDRKAMCEVASKYCMFLEDIKPFNKKIPFRGSQGIFNVPDELIKEKR